MSMWIRAICTRSVAGVTAQAVYDELSIMDFWTAAEHQGLDESEGQAAADALRVVQDFVRPSVMYLHYRPAPRAAIGLERWSESASLREEVDELRDEVGDQPGPSADRIRQVLGDTCDIVAFELKASDAAGMGWPLAFHAAMFLAAQGAGLVEAEGVWWDPEAWQPLD